ncbi:MAG: hypothetical protein RLZZ571_171 [Actinomycetota bacterium]
MKLKTPGLILTWVFSRTWILLSGFGYLFYPEGGSLFSDVQLYDWWAGNMQHGHFPINDDMWQYPPLAALVFILGYLVAPATVGFVFLALAIDALLFYFLLEAGLENNKKNYLPATVWVSAGFLVGPIMLGRFDVFPTFFAVLALLFISKPSSFGINIAFGALLKVWPALLFLGVPRNRFKNSFVWFLGTFISFSILLTLWWPNSFSFLTGQRSRGLQIESVGALPYMLWHQIQIDMPIEFRYGAVEVVAPGVNLVSAIITIAGLLLLGQIALWQYQNRLSKVSVTDIGIYVVAVSMVTSRVLSPQYIIWLFGLLAVCALNPVQNFRKIFGLIAVSAFLGQLIYPYLYYGYMGGQIIPLVVQIMRIITLLWATYLMWSNIKSKLTSAI